MQNDSKRQGSDPESLNWYALKVFFNRTRRFEELLEPLVSEMYVPRNVIISLMFVRTSPTQIENIRQKWYGWLMVYVSRPDRTPYIIPEHDMDVFRFVTSMADKNLKLIDPEAVRFKSGEKVRVTDGLFKGAEGYIKRIQGNKRLIVTIHGVVAVATSYIPAAYLEKLENND